MVLRACPDCGASLDPGERCDCQKEKTAPVLQYRGGKVENGVTANFSISILQKFVNDFKIQSLEDKSCLI